MKKWRGLSFHFLNGFVVIRINVFGYFTALYSSKTSLSFRFSRYSKMSRLITFLSSRSETNSNFSILFIGSSMITPCRTDFRKAILLFNCDSETLLS